MRTLLLMVLVFWSMYVVYNVAYWLTHLCYWVGRHMERRRRERETSSYAQEN